MDDAGVVAASLATPEVFGELFERYFTAVYRFCERRVGRDRAEDLAGETFRRAFEARSRYDPTHSTALPWLLGIGMNLVRNDLRSRGAGGTAMARVAAQELGVVPPDEASETVSAIQARADLAAVGRALRLLPQDDVDALLLHVWDGLSYAEVGVVLGVPVGTVRSRLSRLRARLAHLLDQHDDCPGPARART